MVLSLDQVHGFVVIAEEGSFRRAAARLRMTQPPLSRQIQRLERKIGVRLLERTPQKVELTPAGTVFLAEARRLLALAEAAPGTARRVANGHTGTVRIGFTAAAGLGCLGAVLNRVSETLPKVELVLNEAASAQQLDELSSGRLDLGFCRPPFESDEFEGLLVHRDPLVLAVPDDHRLVGSPSVPVADLEGEHFLAYSLDSARYFADLMTRALSGIVHTVGDRVAQLHTMLALVTAGRGVALVPETVRRLHPEGVRYLSLTGVSECAELYAVWRKHPTNPALRRFVDLLETRNISAGSSRA